MMMLPTDAVLRDRFAANMAALLRNDLPAYVHRAFLELHPGEKYLPAFYIRAICHQLERVERGEVRRLLILLPPRHLKSHCASVAFSTWYLGRHPTASVIGASYNADLAQSFSGQARRLIEAPWHRAVFPELALDPRKASVEELRIRHHGGRRLATSVGGTLTGKGANVIIIDDPMKADDAFSEARRDDVYGWITSTVVSRFNDPKTGALIVVAQRLHVDDLPGRLIAAGGWAVLELPAIGTDHARIEIGRGAKWLREPGELLHAERIDAATLEQIRREIGNVAFEAQYQQRPAPAEGNLIRTEWFGTYEKALPRKQYEAVIQSWDPAAVPGNSNDYSVCTTWGLIGSQIDLLHVHRERHGFPDLQRAALKLRQTWAPNLIVIESSHTGIALRQDLQKRGFREVRGYSPKGTKEERMAALTPMLERGEVRLPRSASWLEPFLEECGQFPNGKYDDQVDTLSQALFAMPAAAIDLSKSGPYAVGALEVMIEDVTGLHPLKTLIWYPAVGHAPDLLAPPGPATKDAPPAEGGPFPLVVVIHGFPGAGIRYQHWGLLLASHGFVVMAPDFDSVVNRKPDPGISKADKVQLAMTYNRPANVVHVIAFADALTAPGGKLEGVIETARIGILGHSAGGMTALQAGGARIDFPELVEWCAANPDERWLESCDMIGHELAIARAYGRPDAFAGPLPALWDRRVSALVLAAPGGGLQVFGDTGIAAVDVPTLIMVGLPDEFVRPEINAYWAYKAISSPDKSLAVFDEGGHLMFVNPAPPQTEEAESLATAFFLSVLKQEKAARAMLLPQAVDFPGLVYETTLH